MACGAGPLLGTESLNGAPPPRQIFCNCGRPPFFSLAAPWARVVSAVQHQTNFGRVVACQCHGCANDTPTCSLSVRHKLCKESCKAIPSFPLFVRMLVVERLLGIQRRGMVSRRTSEDNCQFGFANGRVAFQVGTKAVGLNLKAVG